MDVEFLTPALDTGAGPCGHDAGITQRNQRRRWGVCLGIRHVQLLYMAATAAAMGGIRAMTSAAASALLDHTNNNRTTAGYTVAGYNSIMHGSFMSLHLLGYALAALPIASILPDHSAYAYGSLRENRSSYRWMRPTPALVVLLAASAGVAILMPVLIVREWWAWSCLVMMVGGMLQAMPGAALRVLTDRWMPPKEAKSVNTAIFLCMQVGCALGWACSGRVVSMWWLHWRGVWYAAGGAALVTAVCVAALTADGPDTHPAAGDDEREYIRDAQTHANTKTSPRTRWSTLLTSRELLGALCARAAPMAVCGILSSYGVVYLQRAGYALEESMYIMSIGALCHLLVGAVYGRCVRMYGVYGTTDSHDQYRKTYYIMINNGLGCVLSVSLLAALSQSVPGVRAAVVIVAAMAVQGIVQQNELEYFRESFGADAGRALSLSVSLSGTVMAAAPIAAAMLLGDHNMDSAPGWRCVFLSLAALQAASSATISVLGTRHKQTKTQCNDSGIVYRPCSTHADKNLLPLEE